MPTIDEEVICWPYWLPIPEREGYGYTLKDNDIVRTEMDAGVLIRLKHKSDSTLISCTVTLSDCEMEWLEAFEAERLKQGVTWFLMPLWIAGTVQHYLVQFTDRPKVSQVQGNVSWVSLKFRTKHRVLPPVDGVTYGDRNDIVEWPSNLPILQEGYTYTPRSTDMKSGSKLSTVRRPEFFIDEVTMTCRMSLSYKQVAVFEWFEREVLNRGARWFKMNVWIGGDLVPYMVRFKSRPKFVLTGLWTAASFELELENREFMHPTVVETLRVISPEELISFLETLHERLYVFMPGLTIIPDDVYTKI